MKGKYADFVYTIKKTKEGFAWTIWADNWMLLETSLENDDKEDRYFETQRAAILNCKEAIEDIYS